MSDLDRFVALYASFGITCIVHRTMYESYYISFQGYDGYTDKKLYNVISGPESVSYEVEFDQDGKFIEHKLDSNHYCY